MTLADQIAADLPIFVNSTEFGQVRDVGISGFEPRPVSCVLDDDLRLPNAADGVFLSESLLHVMKSDLPAVPLITQRMSVDGKLGNVVKVDEAMGMLSIRLQWFES